MLKKTISIIWVGTLFRWRSSAVIARIHAGTSLPDRKYIDSILPAFQNMKDDSVKVDHLQNLAWMYLEIDPDSSLLFGQQGEPIAG